MAFQPLWRSGGNHYQSVGRLLSRAWRPLSRESSTGITATGRASIRRGLDFFCLEAGDVDESKRESFGAWSCPCVSCKVWDSDPPAPCIFIPSLFKVPTVNDLINLGLVRIHNKTWRGMGQRVSIRQHAQFNATKLDG